MTLRSVVKGVGSALPERRVSNEELAETVDTSDAWIVERTGIRSRYVAGEGETTASLATAAALKALAHAGVDAAQIDLIVLATATPDQTFPSSATKVQAALGIAKPRVNLLNIGTEELKGTDELKEAAGLLRDADYLAFRFDGFTEGDQLSRGQVDVVVTDGFSGNIALKTAEGTARFVTDLLRRAFKSSLRSKAGFALSRPALNLLKHHLDPNNHNGAVFLGLNGLVVKSHGSATPKGVANAIGVAARMVRNDITRKIGDDLDNFRAHAFANEAAQ
jgi:hypothetical protein